MLPGRKARERTAAMMMKRKVSFLTLHVLVPEIRAWTLLLARMPLTAWKPARDLEPANLEGQ